LISVLLLCPAGLTMGTAFPLGMKLAAAHDARVTPWLWGVNGALSVCASVLAIVIALASAISWAYWAGALAYACALLAFAKARGAQAR
jgi:hypothetical protein